MLDNGASGYVLKNARKEELQRAITTVAMGKTYLSFEAVLSLREQPADTSVITRRESAAAHCRRFH
ncbi:MAG TPA: hypothetical protein VFM90_01245 [Cyclobacteriaceae bacterium]|nr:hypothetical protein [Cyclobacteriaceae bacterium]